MPRGHPSHRGSERRFFARFVGTEEPPVDELMPPGEKPVVHTDEQLVDAVHCICYFNFINRVLDGLGVES